MTYLPLTRKAVRDVIDGRGCAERVPVLLHQWISPDVFPPGSGRDAVTELLREYPRDALFVFWRNCEIFDAPPDDPGYCWMPRQAPEGYWEGTIDSRIALKDWNILDEMIECFPESGYRGLFPDIPPEDGRYRIAHWWFTLFERHWSLRGMDNALTDFYMYPDQVHRLYRALTDFYRGIIRRAKQDLNADAVYTTDDLGTQEALFFDDGVFKEFFYPYYAEMIDEAHRHGMHFWLHSCGNIESILPDLIAMKLDVINPIQKYAMDERKIAARYGDKICIWGGFDVQKMIPFGSVEDVRKEVRSMFETYFRREGKFMFTFGNGITADAPIESLRALFEEAYGFGTEIAAEKGRKKYRHT